MKKTLLFGAAALTALSMSAAFTLPTTLDNRQVVGISKDGKTVVTEYDGSVTLVDLTTGEETSFEGESMMGYTVGQGNMFSEDGVLVGSDFGHAAYLKDGEWIKLSVPNENEESYAQGISADGKTIVGIVGLAPLSVDESSSVMQAPAFWTLKEDGSYSEYQMLPYPEKDFTGRMPQYVTAMCVTSDSKTIVGQVTDYSGGLIYLITWTLNNENEWEYTQFEKNVNPEGLVFPEWPGEDESQPSAEDFLSENEMEIYEADVEKYWAGESDDYPIVADYLSEEGKAEYDKAMAEWKTKHDEWLPKYEAFDEVLVKCQDVAKPLVFNDVYLSSDNKTVLSTAYEEIEDPDPMAWMPFFTSFTPITFDISDGSFKLFKNENINACAITDNGTIFGWMEETWTTPRTAYVYTPGSDEAMLLSDYYKEYAPETYSWMEENMVHPMMVDFDPDTYDPITEDIMFTGVPVVSADLSVVSCCVANYWDYETTYNDMYSYILPGATTALKGILAEDNKAFNVSALKGGLIAISGEADSVEVYNMSGHLLFKSAAGRVVKTGLCSGTYIVKVSSKNGTKVLKTTF